MITGGFFLRATCKLNVLGLKFSVELCLFPSVGWRTGNSSAQGGATEAAIKVPGQCWKLNSVSRAQRSLSD